MRSVVGLILIYVSFVFFPMSIAFVLLDVFWTLVVAVLLSFIWVLGCVFCDRILLWILGAKRLTHSEDSHLNNATTHLCFLYDVYQVNVYVVENSFFNAMATANIFGTKSIVVDRYFIQKMSRVELKTLLAWELLFLKDSQVILRSCFVVFKMAFHVPYFTLKRSSVGAGKFAATVYMSFLVPIFVFLERIFCSDKSLQRIDEQINANLELKGAFESCLLTAFHSPSSDPVVGELFRPLIFVDKTVINVPLEFGDKNLLILKRLEKVNRSSPISKISYSY